MVIITDKEFKKFAEFIKSNYGIYLKEEKKTLLMGRLHNILEQKGFKSFSEYYDYIVSDKTGNAVINMLNKVTTNHTFFMREMDHFDYFRCEVLPYLSRTVKSKDLRIWSAGCSSGQEPYTLAMIIDEYFSMDKALWDTKILATDISNRVLEIAEKGEYENDELEQIPNIWRTKYFKKTNNGKSLIDARVKNEVIFRNFNLMQQTFPFKRKFHVIFCRNVMIYFDNQTKVELINKFYELTEDGGYLFIGHSESLNRGETKYKYIMPAVYRK